MCPHVGEKGRISRESFVANFTYELGGIFLFGDLGHRDLGHQATRGTRHVRHRGLYLIEMLFFDALRKYYCNWYRCK